MVDDKIKIVTREVIKGVMQGINYDDPVVRYRGSKVLRITRVVADKDIKIPLTLAIDVFYTFYLPMPILVDVDKLSEDKKYNYHVINSLLRSSFIHEIRSKTIVDGLMSSIAASIFLAEFKKQEASRTKSGKEEQPRDEKDIRSDVEKIVSNLSRDLDNIKKLRTLIEGEQPGSVSMMAYEEYGPELIKLAQNAEVRRILDLLTGIKPWTISISEKKRKFKHGEIVGYETGKDIERIVPSNLALPDELFYIKLLEGKLLLYQKILSEGRGSLYVLLDKSGSMDGLKMVWAKAVALSLYMRAVKEHRVYYFRFFDSIPYPLARVDKHPKASQIMKLIDYIARVKGSGGTDITRAVITACSDIRSGSVGDANDIILITDGVDRVAEQLLQHNLRKANAKLYTVMVLGNNRSLKNISSRYFAVTKLTQRDILQIVESD